jgi:hypothetical protein
MLMARTCQMLRRHFLMPTIIRELRKKSGDNDLALMMFVTDQSGQTVLSLPFFPGC